MILGSVTLCTSVDVDEHDAWRVRGGALAAASPRGNGSIRIPLEFVRFGALCDPQEDRSPVIARARGYAVSSKYLQG